jgi:hypothetical protein
MRAGTRPTHVAEAEASHSAIDSAARRCLAANAANLKHLSDARLFFVLYPSAQAIVSVRASERRGCAGTRPAACGYGIRDTCGHTKVHL